MIKCCAEYGETEVALDDPDLGIVSSNEDRSFGRGVVGGVEGGDGAGLEGDGGVGGLELGFALGELGAD